jgi:signal transduction histidine kinase
MPDLHGSPALRHRVLTSILAVTALAVIVFALPLGIVVQRLYRTEMVTALQQEAARVAAVVPDGLPSTAAALPPGNLPRESLSSPAIVGVYDTAGRRVAGAGPRLSALAANGGASQVRGGQEGIDLAVIAPIPSDQKMVGTVRAALPYSAVNQHVYRAWAAMAVFAAAAIALAAVVARRQAVRLATPLERLTHAARALGDGDFTVRAERFGVREAETASQALEDTATHLGRLLARERTFSSDVSHQLRTPLTALRAGLETAVERPDADLRPALRDALIRSEHLSDIVEDLVSLLRQPGFSVVPVNVGALLAEVTARWEGPLSTRDRRLVLACGPGIACCLAPPAAVRQILDVLISNALWHGEGTVTVTTRQAGDYVDIEVCDEGAGLDSELPLLPAGQAARGAHASPAGPHRQWDGHGRGLPLACSLAAASGGCLTLRHAAPEPVFALSLPAPAAAGQPSGRQPAAPASKR